MATVPNIVLEAYAKHEIEILKDEGGSATVTAERVLRTLAELSEHDTDDANYVLKLIFMRLQTEFRTNRPPF